MVVRRECFQVLERYSACFAITIVITTLSSSWSFFLVILHDHYFPGLVVCLAVILISVFQLAVLTVFTVVFHTGVFRVVIRRYAVSLGL